MQLIRALESERIDGISYPMGLFKCPVCKQEVKKIKTLGKRYGACSPECADTNRAGETYAFKSRTKTGPCELCKKETKLRRFKKKWTCDECMLSGEIPINREDAIYTSSNMSHF